MIVLLIVLVAILAPLAFMNPISMAITVATIYRTNKPSLLHTIGVGMLMALGFLVVGAMWSAIDRQSYGSVLQYLVGGAFLQPPFYWLFRVALDAHQRAQATRKLPPLKYPPKDSRRP